MLKIIFLGLIISTKAKAGLFDGISDFFSKKSSCPKISLNTPKCPKGSSRILDNTYPIKALVISNKPHVNSNNSFQAPSKFILEAINAFGSDNIKSLPKIIIPCGTNCFDKIKLSIKNELITKNYPEEKISRIISKIHQANVKPYTWQQDYFESFYDPETGAPITREFSSYAVKVNYKRLAKKAKRIGCGIKIGEELKRHTRSFGSGEMGGNLEGLPAGGCLYGNNMDRDLAKKICSNIDDHSQITTDFLSVGHVDEIIKVTPRKTKSGEPKECGFTISYASPKLAIELMEKNPSDLLYKDIPPAPEDKNFLNNRLNKLCKIINQSKKAIKANQLKNSNPSSPAIKVKGTFFNILNLNAYAGQQTVELQKLEDCDPGDIKTFTNMDFLEGLKYEHELYEYNLDIDDLMQDNLKVITDSILKRLPQCKNHLDLLPVPDIYNSDQVGTSYIIKNGKKVLRKKGGDASSFFPSPTNGVFLNKTLIYSDPEIPIFKKYLKKNMEKRNNKAKFIPTYEYSHLGGGNIHCSTHTLPYCRP